MTLSFHSGLTSDRQHHIYRAQPVYSPGSRQSHSIFQVLCNFLRFPRTTKTQTYDQQQLSGLLFHSSRPSVIQVSDLKTPNSSLTTVQCPPWLLREQRAPYRTPHDVNVLSAFFPSTEQKYLLSSFASVLTILRALCSHIKPSCFFVCWSYFIPGYSFLLPSFVSVMGFHELLAPVLLKHLPLFFLMPDYNFLRALKSCYTISSYPYICILGTFYRPNRGYVAIIRT